MIRILSTIVLLFFVALSVSAQTLVGDRVRLNTGPCTLLSGSGSPEGAVIGKICDHYIDVVSGTWWEKWTGTGNNTGWGVGHNANATVNGTLLVSGATTLSSTLAVTSNTNLSGYVGHPSFVSQLARWRIDDLGGGDLRYLFVDELHAKSFIADLEQALAGGQIICKSVAVLGANFTNPSPGSVETLTVRDLPSAENMAVYQSGDYVGLRTFSRAAGSLTISDTYGVVTSYTDLAGGLQAWVYTRGSGANGGGMATSTVVQIDGLAIDYGVSGNGCHEINAIDGANGINSPYAQTWTWITSPIPANRVLRTRLGNQRGVTGVTNEYGLVAGDYAAVNGRYFRASNTAFELHGIDLSLWQGSTKTFFVDHAVPSLALGASVPTAYGTGTGIWMGNDGGTYKFRAGIPNGAGLFWDGATLTVRGTGGSATNMIRNSECRVGTEDWSAGYTTATPPTLSFNLASWRLNDVSSTCYLTEAGTPANATAWFLVMNDAGARFPVVVGNRYEASVYFGLHRVSAGTQFIEWFNTAGMSISITGGNACTTASPGGLYLSGYCRSGVVATAPAGAVSAQTYLVGAHDGTGANPFMFATRAFFGEATSTQTLLSEWGPAGTTEITGGLIRTGTIVAGHIAANTITAAKIAAGTITATEIAAATITGAKIAATTITAGNIAANTITAGQIAAGTITGTQIAGTTITGGHIAATTITAGNIAAGTITADKLSVSSLSAITANLGSVTAGTININSGQFSVDASGNVELRSATIPSGGSFSIIGGMSIDAVVEFPGVGTGSGNLTLCAVNVGGTMRLAFTAGSC